MGFLRTVVTSRHARCTICIQNFVSPKMPRIQEAMVVFNRYAHTQQLTKNIMYISNDKEKLNVDLNTMKLNKPVQKPLCVIMNWLMSRPKHVQKYADLYLTHGYDVISVSCSPWQLMWPARGSQVIGKELLRFLEANDHKPVVVHGFSVGAYVWAELLVQSLHDEDRYQPVLDRIKAQVWDSPADIYEIPVGFPSALFPQNKFLQNSFRAYITGHMKFFHNMATRHYMRATDVYHATPCRAPGLFLVSKTDPVGAAKRSRHAHDCWQKIGIKCNFKCWDKSPHVSHYIYHPKEYKDILYSHLEDCGVISRRAADESVVRSKS